MILVAALIFVLIKIFQGVAATENNSETIETEQQQEEDTSRALSTGDDFRQLIVSTDAKYSFNSLAVQDLSLRNYTPNQKQQGMDWDSSYDILTLYGDYDDEAWDKFEAVVNQFKADYCGEEVTFYDVNEDSLQQNMRWD